MNHADPRDFETRVQALRCRLAGDRAILSGLRFLLALERRAHFDPSQPRDDLGRWRDTGLSTTRPVVDPEAKPPGTSVGDRVRVAGPFDWRLVDLTYEEGRQGAHTILLHVGKTEGELEARVIASSMGQNTAPPDGWRSGSFRSLSEANALVGEALRVNSSIVSQVRSGFLPSETIEYRPGGVTGFEAVRLSRFAPVRIQATNAVKVLIIFDPERTLGFRIHTAYPITRNRDE
ncbi:MAG: hypothetical protein LWW93_16785 [Hyphomicrobiales bacterium]|nr:hypothetical protein [Hyphomicrobiales bacterium]